MGVHTGEPRSVDGNYVGLDVHQAARVMAAGHGGQVLVSHATRSLLGDVELRDLGEHLLKDLAGPQRLYQLELDGLPGEFPPLNTLENRFTSLPAVPNAFVGRERELAEAAALLAPRRRAAADADRPGRHRQDPARAASRVRPGGRASRRRGLRLAHAGARLGARDAGDRPGARPARAAGRERARDAHRVPARQAAAPRAGQLRAGAGRGTVGLEPARRSARREAARHEPHAASPEPGARLPRAAARTCRRRSSSSPSARRRQRPTSGSPTRTPRRSRRSAAGSTACRSRSSWRRRGCGRSRRRRSCAASTSGCRS